LNLSENKNLDPADYHVYNLDEAAHSDYNIYESDNNLVDLATPWTEKDWDGVFYTEEGSQFGRLRLEWSEQWLYTQKIVTLLRENSINSLFFTIPRNFELLEVYNFVDYASYFFGTKGYFQIS